MKNLKVGLISLGCDKNRIDSEIVLSKLKDNNLQITNNAKDAEIIIINTCAFIEDAKQESINTILEIAEYKTKFNLKVLIVSGCLSQRYKDELITLIPEIDIMLGVNNYDLLINYINCYLENNERQCHCDYSNTKINEGNRVITTGKTTAYLRISEGCNNFCSYCIIPKIRGIYRSRKIENIIKEAQDLVSNGIKELILVAQDTTNYGIDIYGEKTLPKLINELSKINEIEWIRLLYTYPESITDELIKEISSNNKVCNYIDMPIQHINDDILKAMKRKSNKKMIQNVINKLKEKDIIIRTSIIVGFPGETEKQFIELKDFIKEVKFDKLGVFTYSQEENTPAAKFADQVDEEIKIARQEDLMLVQKKISKKINNQKIGKIYKVLIEGQNSNYYYGRSYEMSPDIDGEILIKCDTILNIGQIIHVKIIDNKEYDLIGVVCYEFS